MDTDNQTNLIDLNEPTDTQKQPLSNTNEDAEPTEQKNIMDIIGNGQLVKKVCVHWVAVACSWHRWCM